MGRSGVTPSARAAGLTPGVSTLRDVARRTTSSLHNRGLLGSLDHALTLGADVVFDMTWRVHTRGVVDLQGLDTGGANLDHAVEYHPTRVREFWAVMSHLRIPTGGQGFVDFGCGKGRVLIMASEYGFEHVSGVEFAAELHDVAQNNVRRYLGLSKMRTRFNLVHGDAATYRIEPCQSVFYFYFPFKDTVMQAVMDNIRASLRDYPRQAYLVYNYPKCREIVEGMSIFELVLNAKFWGNSWRAYVSRGSVS